LKTFLIRLALICLATFVLVELILWAFFRQGREPVISETFRQDVTGLKPSVTYEKNGLGLRSLSLDRATKPEGAIRIVCLGLSTTEQATQETADTWSGILETRLRETFADRPGGPVEIQVGAYAKGGYKMHEMMRWARLHLLELEPDIVVTLFGINSLVTDQGFLKGGVTKSWYEIYLTGNEPLWPERMTAFSQTARHWRAISESSDRRAYAKQTDGYNFDLRGLAGRAAYWKLPLAADFGDDPKRTSLFRGRTEILLDWLQENEVRPVVLAQPLLVHDGMNYQQSGDQVTFDDPYRLPEEINAAMQQLQAIWFPVNTGEKVVRLLPGDLRREMTRFNEAQRLIAEERGAAYVPLDELIPTDLDHFFDDCHFTDLGSERVADAIFPTLRAEVERVLAERAQAQAQAQVQE